MVHFLLALKTVAPLFLVIFTGLLFSRTKACSEKWIDVLNKYALYIGFPALVIASLMHLEIGEQSYKALLLANSAYIVVCLFIAFISGRIFRLSTKLKRTLFLLLPFGNIAYLGIPVLQNAYGPEILPAAAIISAIYVFWMLTLALILIEATGAEKLHLKKLTINLATNPLLLSVFVGMALVVFKLKLPEFAASTIQLFADSVTAVVLFSLGFFLGMQKLGKLAEWYTVFGFVALTMIILPLGYYHVLRITNIDSSFLKASAVDAIMPLGLTPYAISLQYKLETKLAARIVVLGTLLSVVIIPVWIAVLK